MSKFSAYKNGSKSESPLVQRIYANFSKNFLKSYQTNVSEVRFIKNPEISDKLSTLSKNSRKTSLK